MYIIEMRTRIHAVARAVGTVAAVAVLGGCAMKGDVRDLQDEIRALAARQDSLLAELRRETLSTQDSVRTQSDQMFDFRGDINQAIRQIAQSLTRLEALAGENQRSITALRNEVARGGGGGARPPTTVVDPGAGVSEQLVAGGPGNPDEVWQAAMTQYDRGSLNAASMAFQQFLEDYPSDRRAAAAHFNLADILEQQERPDDALEAFQQIPQLYPTSDRVPDAQFRAARLLRDLGDIDQAKAILQRIINTYPGTLTATLAREMLDEIG